MKKNYLFKAMLFVAAAVLFGACGDKEEDTPDFSSTPTNLDGTRWELNISQEENGMVMTMLYSIEFTDKEATANMGPTTYVMPYTYTTGERDGEVYGIGELTDIEEEFEIHIDSLFIGSMPGAMLRVK